MLKSSESGESSTSLRLAIWLIQTIFRPKKFLGFLKIQEKMVRFSSTGSFFKNEDFKMLDLSGG